MRDWAAVDYYEALGVRPDATDDEIARAFRALAKRYHPDVQGGPVTEQGERFRAIRDAYEVLSNPRLRFDYDDVYASVRRVDQRPATSMPPSRRTGMVRWTPAKAVAAIAAGVACFVVGILFSVYTLGVQANDRAARAGRMKAVAVAELNARGTIDVQFVTAAAQTITIPEPRRINPGVLRPQDAITLLYDPARPTDVIVDETHFGRDFTYWFIAAKLVVCGPIIVVVGERRRRMLRARRQRSTPPAPVAAVAA